MSQRTSIHISTSLTLTMPSLKTLSNIKRENWLPVLLLCFLPLMSCDPEVTSKVVLPYIEDPSLSPEPAKSTYDLGNAKLSGSDILWNSLYTNAISVSDLKLLFSYYILCTFLHVCEIRREPFGVWKHNRVFQYKKKFKIQFEIYRMLRSGTKKHSRT